MIAIFDANSGQKLGTITEEQLKFLIGEMEEESTTDQDYYLSALEVDIFEADGADPGLLAFLRRALGNHQDMDIRWERE